MIDAVALLSEVNNGGWGPVGADAYFEPGGTVEATNREARLKPAAVVGSGM